MEAGVEMDKNVDEGIDVGVGGMAVENLWR